ncbi:MAG TPA: plastocyanin/azurin family copper-binding protein [Nitrososphaeraceae archaeon]|nr:plastocyanin/azurin family copper-binding protein [Nitrososphaeraceae archaeon]
MSVNTVMSGKIFVVPSLLIVAIIAIDGSIASASPVNETKVQAGIGNGSIAMIGYSPNHVEIASGQSVTWYNPTAVAEPHTVSFILDNTAKADLIGPFAIPEHASLSPLVPDSNSEPLLSPDATAIIAVNKRAYNPTVIDSTDRVSPLNQNANYTLTGTEKYVNSGWLLPKGLEQTYPGSGNTFTVTFQKPGNYNYLCLVHPYMTGSVIVK